MRARKLFFMISSSLLISCVNTEFAAFDPNLEWNIKGRISVSRSETSGIYNFAVSKKNEVEELVVFSLFGLELYRTRLLSNGVLVGDPRFGSLFRESEDLDHFRRDDLEFILQLLPFWVTGQDKFGKALPMGFQENGWSIELADFLRARPKTIILDKGIIRAKIRILEIENLN